MNENIWNIENKLGTSKLPIITFSKKRNRIYHQRSLAEPAGDVLKELFLNNKSSRYDSIKHKETKVKEAATSKSNEDVTAKENKKDQVKSINSNLKKRQASELRQQERERSNKENMPSSSSFKSYPSSSTRLFTNWNSERYSCGSINPVPSVENMPCGSGVKHKVISQMEEDKNDNSIFMEKPQDKESATYNVSTHTTTSNSKEVVARSETKNDNIFINTTTKKTPSTLKLAKDWSAKNTSFFTFVEPIKPKETKGKMRALQPFKPIRFKDGLLNLHQRKTESKTDSQQNQVVSTMSSPPYSFRNKVPKTNPSTGNSNDSYFEGVDCIAVAINQNKDSSDSCTQTQIAIDNNGKMTTTQHMFSMNWPAFGDI